MEAASRKSLEVAALGRPFQLGMLYDCRNDCLIPGIKLWDHDDLRKDTDERTQPKTEFDVIASDSVEDRAWALDVDPSLKASFIGGLVEVDGSAKYLKDKKASKTQSRVTLKYKTTTKMMELSMSHLGRGNVKYPYVFEQGIATHVVTAVLYGGQAFFVFDREVSETEDQQNIEGNLQVMIKKIPQLSVEGKGSLKLTDTEEATVDKFSCKFYGDFALKQNPVSFQDAVKVYATLPALLGENGENAVPVRVWLLSLEILDSSAAKIVRQISVGLINETQSVMENFNEIEMQCNDITKRKIISYFPEIGPKVISFNDMCLGYKSVFQRSLSSILPLIRGGGIEECVLANILTKKEQSPFNSNKLKEWLDCKDQEINLLQMYTDMMEDTKILASKSELQSEIFKNRDKNVVCFAFTSLGEEEPYLSCLRSHLKVLSTAKLTEPTEEDGKDVEPYEFYLSDAMSEKMKEQVILFIDFAKANKDNKKTHFIAASIPNDEHKGASIYLYKDGIKKSDHFELPSKPEKPNASDVTHDSVTIKLSHPQCGSSEITHYLVEYCANDSDGWQFIKVPKSNLECTVSGLLPHTDYRFRYKAVYPAGVSLTSEAESIKTLPTSPPGKPKQTYVDSEEIVVAWTKPDSIGHGVNIENYVVEYRIASCEKNENEEDWMKKTNKDEVCHITKLQRDTKYDVRIICNCGESGQSKESLTISISTLSGTSTLAEKIKQKSKCLSQGFLSVYKVPLQEIPTNLDGCKRYAFSKEKIREHRTIMVIGATGAGKSTIINGMINYILGVKWEDNFRFKLIDEGVLKSQAESQTSLVTAYEINYQEGYTISYSITIIDTPGFGDTRGIERDRAITEQIRTFFTSDNGISAIDTVCFVTQASLARLTHAQKYVFDSILSIFGKDIADNIQMLVTFADGQKPPVLEAIKESNVPCPRTEKGIPVHFKFNNSALFADNSTSVNMKNSDNENEEDGDENFDKMFWRMGVTSMKKFFVALTSMETKSLKLTKEVLRERKQLEIAVTGLQPQIRAGLAKLDEIKSTQQKIEEHEAEINTVKDFEFEVEVTKPVQVSIAGSGQYITNCQQCYVTCHFPCGISNDIRKALCSAMNRLGNCTVCVGKCPWNVHFNQKYRWEYKKMKEKITSEELKAKYEQVSGAKLTAQEIIKQQEEEIQYLQDEILELMETSQRCLARLQEIALKPNPLSTPEYIDLLIESEKAEAKPGFLPRIQSLEAMKEQAVIIQKVSKKQELLPSEAMMYKAKTERQEEQNKIIQVKKYITSFFVESRTKK